MTILNFKRIKPLSATILTVALLLTSSSAVFAANQTKPNNTELSAVSVKQIINGVSTKAPTSITPNSTSVPTSVWNIANSGAYSFSGWSYFATMYTNYKLTGKTSYHMSVNNNSSNAMTVRVRSSSYTYSTTSIPANSGASWDVFGNGMTATTQVYVQFDGTKHEL